MAKGKKTIFQQLGTAMLYGFDKNIEQNQKKIRSYTVNPGQELFRTKDAAEYEKTKEQLKQEKYLAQQWYSSGVNLARSTSMVLNNLKLMFRDADIMDGYPEIGAALDIYAEEACTLNSKGQIINISSKSERVKKVLEDLFVNRLNIHTSLPMWTRTACKYGNCFVMLNVDSKKGVIGARQLPTYEVERVEDSIYNPYSSSNSSKPGNDDTEFIWYGQNTGMPFKSWQVAHFRLLTDSTYLPYGSSVLNKARRHFRMLSMMEDMMLIYRLERSIERRVFKIFVGNIDDADIPAYVQEIANTFKRTPIIDPETGQVDLKKASLDVSQDIFIPVKDHNTSSPIETLPTASNLDKIEDLSFIQNKVLTALRIPKEFLNFEEASGDGKNLALKDIRFTRTINRVQQNMIMELSKIAVIHLFINGFSDDLMNFKITMNNPSTQSEILRLEELQLKLTIIANALNDPGNGIQIMSLTRAQREILGWSDEEIQQNMLEIRIERALAAELTKTEQIIKRTGFYDKVDKLYGEPNAEYVDTEGEGGDGDLGGGGGGGFGGDFGGDMGDDFGGDDMGGDDLGGDDMGGDDMGGDLGGEDLGGEVEEPMEGEEPQMEQLKRKVDNLLTETKQGMRKARKVKSDKYYNTYTKYLKESVLKKDTNDGSEDITPLMDKFFIKNDEMNKLIDKLDEID